MGDMSLFQWSPSYSVDYPEIDNQHKRLFELADRLHAAMLVGKANTSLSKLLADLVDYTKHHFSTEERLMQASRYPNYLQHKAEHDKLTTQVLEFQKSFQAGKGSLTIGLMEFLKDWLRHHIGESDRRAAEHLRKKAA